MKRRSRDLKVVGLLIFLNLETHLLPVSEGSILRLYTSYLPFNVTSCLKVWQEKQKDGQKLHITKPTICYSGNTTNKSSWHAHITYIFCSSFDSKVWLSVKFDYQKSVTTE